MRPSKSIIAVAAMLLLLSYSITVACDNATEKALRAVEAVNVVSEAASGSIDVTITCDLLETALTQSILFNAEECSNAHTPTSARSSIRAGVNLTRALSRAMAHLAVAMARTAYHTVTALT